MSEQSPVYSKNPILDGVEHVGHWLHEAETTIVDDIPKVITVYEKLKSQAPDAVAQVQAVIADVVALKPLVTAIGQAILSAGTNVAADAAVAAQLDGSVAIFEKLVGDIQALTSTVTQDFTADV